MTEKILKGLNPQQKKAVVHDQGPLLIIAGAGTGKTTVITRRIAHLIVDKKVRPDEILALTFTDKAAMQMQEKVDVLVPYGFTDTWIFTFHAFGDRILRENALELGLNPDFKVLTRPQASVFFKENLFKFPLEYYRPLGVPTKFIDSLINLFSRARDEDVSVGEYLDFAQKLARQSAENPADEALKESAQRHSEIAKCYEQYQTLLLKESKIDFANQFFLAVKLFREHPSILKRYQDQFKYILVDEFQDTNYAQFELVKLLAQKAKNLTVVADDDQSIYKWRGAAVSNILNFLKVYPESEKISLTKNYRSTQPILDCAYKLIQNNNPDRFEVQAKINKRLTGISKKGKAVKHMHFDTISSEADWVAKYIKAQIKSKKYTCLDFAILVRSNSDADPFVRALNMQGIPWQFSGNQGLYSREEVKLCIAFLRLMANPTDSLSLYLLASSHLYQMPLADLTRVMNYAQRRQWDLFYAFKKISAATQELPDLSSEFLSAKETILKDVEQFIELARTHSTGRLLYLFLTQTNFLKQLVENESAENEEKIRNIAKFFDLVKDFEYVASEDKVLHFIRYLDMLIAAGDDPPVAEAEQDVAAVNILTIHKAKGLEFPIVFLVGLVEGRFPWPLRREPIELPEELIKDILPLGDFHLQEERRLFYVGMTRAQRELFLTSSFDYGTKRLKKISRFVSEAVSVKRETKAIKADALEAIERNAPQARQRLEAVHRIGDDDILSLSYFQIDDYLTCPLKYKYVHILRVPIMAHHTVLYGKALHDAIQQYHQAKMKNAAISEDELLKAFESSFRKEGFLSQEHIELRLKSGFAALRNFYREQERLKKVPAHVEKDFSFALGNNRIVGRWDRIDIEGGKAIIIDFKSSAVHKQEDADKRVKESLQLSLYSLAYQKVFGKLPDYKELHFLETGLIGRDAVTEKAITKVVESVDEASSGIRQGNFAATPSRMVCPYCAYNQICPFAQISRP
ncbi:MAG TPA: UvrD-helicase domain-containing protein [Candidatus Omnitrophota bacterium]|nr:UvrD-helicase domain-containing protein [Candidatus Omnitrophota bacterium]HPD85058.1 UvrD-helicase domain-containing protein [Candidatus Omnitrophota bacterium]HRZ03916.1 UvrD-helicase domain-containing protein [Candidatus Omnitrophota bacterium]